jgi:hypothetical protein
MSWPSARDDVETPSARATMSQQYVPNPQTPPSARTASREKYSGKITPLDWVVLQTLGVI